MLFSRREFLGVAAAALPLPVARRSQPIRLFRMNECEIVAGRSLCEAMSWYLDLTGVPPDEAFDDSVLGEIVGDELASLTRIDCDAPPPWDAYRNPRKRTAADALADDAAEGCRAPYLFSSTEW